MTVKERLAVALPWSTLLLLGTFALSQVVFCVIVVSNAWTSTPAEFLRCQETACHLAAINYHLSRMQLIVDSLWWDVRIMAYIGAYPHTAQNFSHRTST